MTIHVPALEPLNHLETESPAVDRRRQMILRIDPQAILDFLKGDAIQATKGAIPKDAVCTGISDKIFFSGNDLAIRIASNEFPMTDQGCIFPELESITFRRIDPLDLPVQ
jgi:hypothetical protein